MTADAVERVAAVLSAHDPEALTCYDHMRSAYEEPVWCCICGAHELTLSWYTHVAQALAAADLLAPSEAAAGVTLTKAEKQALRDVTMGLGFTHRMDAAVERILADRLAAQPEGSES